MTIKEEAQRFIANAEHLLALEILYKETNDISKGYEKLVEARIEFEKMKRYSEDCISKKMCICQFPEFEVAFNSLSERTSFKKELRRAFSCEDLNVFDTLQMERVDYFRKNMKKLKEPVAVASCYENGRIFVFLYGLDGSIEIAMFDLRLKEDLRLKVMLRGYEFSLSYFETTLDKYYRRRVEVDSKMDKVLEMIERLYHLYYRIE